MSQRPTPAFSPAKESLGHIALINLHVYLHFGDGPQALMVIWVTNSQENMLPLFFKLCSDHLSVEAIPRKPLTIDIEAMKGQPIHKHELMMWTPHFVILRNKTGQEITLRRDGRMIVRKASSEQLAHAAATDVMSLVMRDFHS